MFRDYLFSPQLYFYTLLPVFLLEQLFYVTRRRRRLSRSVCIDFLYPVLNAFGGATIAAIGITAIKAGYHRFLPFLNTGLLDDKPIWIQGLGAFLIMDFMFYVSHYLRHRVKWLWFFHAIHHSQRDMNPLTTHRTHALEGIILAAIQTAPIAFVGGTYPVWFWFVVVNHLWGYVIHADLKWNLGPLKYVFVSPQYHRIHHSLEERHFDKNLGERLILWDFLFGTLCTEWDEYPDTGVAGFPDEVSHDHNLVRVWFTQFLYPFRMIARSFRSETMSDPTATPSSNDA